MPSEASIRIWARLDLLIFPTVVGEIDRLDGVVRSYRIRSAYSIFRPAHTIPGRACLCHEKQLALHTVRNKEDDLHPGPTYSGRQSFSPCGHTLCLRLQCLPLWFK